MTERRETLEVAVACYELLAALVASLPESQRQLARMHLRRVADGLDHLALAQRLLRAAGETEPGDPTLRYERLAEVVPLRPKP